MTGIALGPGPEFDAIRTLLERWGDSGAEDRRRRRIAGGSARRPARHQRRRVRPGPPLPVRMAHPAEIGERAVAAALSDLAAMAATPLGVLFALNLPDA